MVKLKDIHFVLQKSTNPQRNRFGVQGICTDLCGTVDVWITVSFQTASELASFPGAVKGECFAKGTEKCKILDNLLDKELEYLEDHGCRKVQGLYGEETWI